MEHLVYKDMVYGARKPGEILAEGTKDEYTFKVISQGTHPCGYVSVPSNHPLHEKLDLLESYIDCHGGITFDGSIEKFGMTEYYIGWDYAHSGDYLGADFGFNSEDDRKYTTLEVIEECLYVIGQLQMYNRIIKDFKDENMVSKDEIRKIIYDLNYLVGG